MNRKRLSVFVNARDGIGNPLYKNLALHLLAGCLGRRTMGEILSAKWFSCCCWLGDAWKKEEIVVSVSLSARAIVLISGIFMRHLGVCSQRVIKAKQLTHASPAEFVITTFSHFLAWFNIQITHHVLLLHRVEQEQYYANQRPWLWNLVRFSRRHNWAWQAACRVEWVCFAFVINTFYFRFWFQHLNSIAKWIIVR